jgi:hypothetical protein
MPTGAHFAQTPKTEDKGRSLFPFSFFLFPFSSLTHGFGGLLMLLTIVQNAPKLFGNLPPDLSGLMPQLTPKTQGLKASRTQGL